jgi:hypothetical protein
MPLPSCVQCKEDPAPTCQDGWSPMRWINEEIDQTMLLKITIAEDRQR